MRVYRDERSQTTDRPAACHGRGGAPRDRHRGHRERLTLSSGGGPTTTASSQISGSTTSLSTDATSSTVSTESSSTSSTEVSGPGAPLNMTVAAAAGTTPAAFDLSTGTYVDGQKVASYNRPDPIDFGRGSTYTALEGVITFRGNNYREGASYGTADVQAGHAVAGVERDLRQPAQEQRHRLVDRERLDRTAAHCQVARRPQADHEHQGRQEVRPRAWSRSSIPCLDGRIYFLDLKDGTATRPTIKSGGGPFKGTGSIYPNGIPILTVGHGEGRSRQGDGPRPTL